MEYAHPPGVSSCLVCARYLYRVQTDVIFLMLQRVGD